MTALRSHLTSLADADARHEDDYWFSLHNKDDMRATPEDTVNPRDEGTTGASTSSSEVANYANLYGFARMSYKFSKELASKWPEEEQQERSLGGR
ncbi:hypothetical protein SASPL_127998 [Salvia splendens]|uniref:Uncharacterized protein n=1 Tax=Salvia splendens TaxID=180675 RepID=A0A8X8XBV9_SALSN|nr:hypothetical protein SASPL_127998 [Salvia splendens]